jgi:bifunctional UDP-N-acetylglucosamine pyrophosphorylase/glucosamine-1-phosphate N-acetyltransferase
MALLAFRPSDPGRHGRVVMRDGYVERIVEWADASETERAEGLCNVGAQCAASADMARWLHRVGADNAKGEHDLTDVVARAGGRVAAVEAPPEELAGINSRAELAAAESVVQAHLRDAAMDAGVTTIDPASVFLCAGTELAPDVTIEPNVMFGPGVKVASGALIRPFSHPEGCTIGPDGIIGPHARLRPNAEPGEAVHVGNFVEVKASRLGAHAKAHHLSYLGDAHIGEDTKFGAGTITCNYDGAAKHRTTIGDGALVATGSVITQDVPPNALAIARQRQVTKTGRAATMPHARKGRR